jgi:molecular chaperone DnaJ
VTDYYEILGVPRGASQDQIKKAYRALAREHHPDTGDGGDEERFKAVSQAYEVLSTPDKRARYDAGVDPSGRGGATGFGFEDIFQTFFGGGAGRRGPATRTQRGGDTLIHAEVTLEEATFGVARDVTVSLADPCATCSGTCCAPGTSPKTCSSCNGSGVIQRVARSLLGQVMSTAPCPTCGGYGTTIATPCPECSGQGRTHSKHTITVDIPAGVETGTRIRLAGYGDAGTGAGPRGDLYVEIREKAHRSFERRGNDLHCTIEIPMTAAALGTLLTVETFDGSREVEVKAGTHSGQTVKLKALGIGHLQRTGRGDLYVHLDVQTPSALTAEQEELVRKLAALRGETRPEARLAAVNAGLFSRLREAFSGRER